VEIDQDNLRTGIAIGCRACHGLCSNYLYGVYISFVSPSAWQQKVGYR